MHRVENLVKIGENMMHKCVTSIVSTKNSLILSPLENFVLKYVKNITRCMYVFAKPKMQEN